MEAKPDWPRMGLEHGLVTGSISYMQHHNAALPCPVARLAASGTPLLLCAISSSLHFVLSDPASSLVKCLHDEQRREAVSALVLPGAPTTCHRKSGHTTWSS